ncbi:unnamed protein product [Arabidopsis halleri]
MDLVRERTEIGNLIESEEGPRFRNLIVCRKRPRSGKTRSNSKIDI